MVGAPDGSESLESDHLVNTQYSTGREVDKGVHGEAGGQLRRQGDHDQDPAKRNRHLSSVSDLDDTDIFYTPAPKFNISNRRRTFTSESDDHDESREQDALAREEVEPARDQDALAREEVEPERDQDALVPNHNTSSHEGDLHQRPKNWSRELEERGPELEAQSQSSESREQEVHSRDVEKPEMDVPVLQGNVPSQERKEFSTEEAREICENFDVDHLGNDDDATASLPCSSHGNEQQVQDIGREEMVTQEEEKVVESAGDEATVFSDEHGWYGAEKDFSGIRDSSEEVVSGVPAPTVLARVKNWEKKTSDFSTHKKPAKPSNIPKLEVSNILKTQETTSDHSRCDDVSGPSDDVSHDMGVSSEQDEVGKPSFQRAEAPDENSEVIPSRDEHEVETLPDDHIGDMVSHDQDDEVKPHDQDDEISHDQDDEISHDQDDDIISHDQDDDLISHDQDDDMK